MAEQLVLDLGHRPALGRSDFIVSTSNAAALARIEDPAGWPGGRLALVGPARSGKSHLAQVWRHQSGAALVVAADLTPEGALDLATGPVVVEDADRMGDPGTPAHAAAETGLFHLHNALAEAGHPMLVTGQEAPVRWQVALPDLASRLQALDIVRIEPPDDALLSWLLVKLAADRHLAIAPEAVKYIVRRIERSFAAAEEVMARLDHGSLLVRRRQISRRLAMDILAEGPADKTEG